MTVQEFFAEAQRLGLENAKIIVNGVELEIGHLHTDLIELQILTKEQD